MTKSHNHPFHLVTVSPWPLVLSISVMFMMIGSIKMFFLKMSNLFILSLILMILILFQWWRDVIRESTFQGMHTYMVYKGLRMGMILFIISELFFFISFFWAYFHMSLSPSIEIGSLWPPKGINPFNPMDIPLLNTIILVSSGITVTWCHNSLINNNIKESLISLITTIMLGIYFSMLQMYEYMMSPFTMSDSVYGSIFFLTTGFHGFHVIIGTVFLTISCIRLMFMHFSNSRHFGFEAASWYWHFVDVIWLFLYLVIYWWSFN